jgi:hypothetical protein
MLNKLNLLPNWGLLEKYKHILKHEREMAIVL